VTFVLGALALASGVVALAGRSLTEDARVLLPAGLIALGTALLIKVLSGDDHPSRTGSTLGPAVGTSRLDIAMPVDDVPREYSPGTGTPAGGVNDTTAVLGIDDTTATDDPRDTAHGEPEGQDESRAKDRD
jgi:hypothetical protein